MYEKEKCNYHYCCFLVGTSMEQVLRHIEEKRWQIRYIRHDHGYITYSEDVWSTSPWVPDTWAPNATVGEKSIKAIVGEYNTALLYPIRVIRVEVLWGFDENSELIAIAIQYSSNR